MQSMYTVDVYICRCVYSWELCMRCVCLILGMASQTLPNPISERQTEFYMRAVQASGKLLDRSAHGVDIFRQATALKFTTSKVSTICVRYKIARILYDGNAKDIRDDATTHVIGMFVGRKHPVT